MLDWVALEGDELSVREWAGLELLPCTIILFPSLPLFPLPPSYEKKKKIMNQYKS